MPSTDTEEKSLLDTLVDTGDGTAIVMIVVLVTIMSCVAIAAIATGIMPGM